MEKYFGPTEQEILLTLFHRSMLGDEPVDDVAKSLGVTRSRAYNLLKQARDAGLLVPTLALQPNPEDELRFRLRDHLRRYNVKDVVVVPSFADDRQLDTPSYRHYIRRRLATVAAHYLSELHWEPGDVLGIGGGRTMAFAMQEFIPPVRGLIVIPLAIGGRWRAIPHVDSAAATQFLKLRFLAVPDKAPIVLCPEMPPGGDPHFRDRPEVQAVFGSPPRPKVTITSMGRRRYEKSKQYPSEGPHPNTSTFVQLLGQEMYYREDLPRKLGKKTQLTEKDLAVFYGLLPDTVYERANAYLEQKRIIADICRYGISDTGAVIETDYDDGFLAIHPERQLREWRSARQSPTETILVLGGSPLAPMAEAALRGGFFSTVIFDTALCLAILDQKNWPEEYRALRKVSDRE